MREMKGIKYIFVIAAIFTFITCMTAVSYADEGYFTDVSSEDYYFDAVNWLYENGIARGNGNGLFRPNDAITHYEICCITDRTNSIIFGDEESCYDGKGQNALFTRQNAYYFADNLDMLDPYPSWIWDGEIEVNAKKDFLTAINNSGIFDGVSPGLNVTRGEYAHLVYCLSTGQFLVPDLTDVYSEPVNINNTTGSWQLRNAVLTGLECIPQNLIDLFNKKGFSIEITDNITLKNYENDKVIGAFYPNQKLIRVSAESKAPYQTVLHEFGHFTEKSFSLSTAEKKLFTLESDQVSKLTSIYSKANYSECYCNAFAEVLWNNETKKSRDEVIPGYSGFIHSAFLQDETKAFSKVNANAFMKSIK